MSHDVLGAIIVWLCLLGLWIYDRFFSQWN